MSSSRTTTRKINLPSLTGTVLASVTMPHTYLQYHYILMFCTFYHADNAIFCSLLLSVHTYHLPLLRLATNCSQLIFGTTFQTVGLLLIQATKSWVDTD